MASKKILAFSSSRSGNSAFLEIPSLIINDFIGSKPTIIAFIPFADAGNKYEEYALAVQEGLKNVALKIKVALPSNAASVIENCDAILVGGGNTFKLLYDLYELNLLNLIREKVNNGSPYIGWSAGSNILAPKISTTNDMPIIEPKSFKALGLFPFQINPHYYNKNIAGFNGETRDDRLEEFLKMNPGVSVVGLPEGSYLKLKEEKFEYFGEEEGALFTSGENEEGFRKKKIHSAENISFLL
ncbi:MAG: dipeptidase PepE [Bacteroidota bacterium]|nr:dipeptidase PepE [Bacteroidota bacterium]